MERKENYKVNVDAVTEKSLQVIFAAFMLFDCYVFIYLHDVEKINKNQNFCFFYVF